MSSSPSPVETRVSCGPLSICQGAHHPELLRRLPPSTRSVSSALLSVCVRGLLCSRPPDTASVCPVISPLTPDKENGGVTHSHSCPPCSLIEARPVGLRKAPRTGCGLWGATELLATSVAARKPLDSKSIAWSLFKLEAQRRRRRFQHRFPPSVSVELQQVYVTGAPLLS